MLELPSMTGWQPWAAVAALALGLILAWKLTKLAVKVVVLGVVLVGAYLVGKAAGWWGPVLGF